MRLFGKKNSYWEYSEMVERLAVCSGIPTQRIEFGTQPIIDLVLFKHGAIFALRIVAAH